MQTDAKRTPSMSERLRMSSSEFFLSIKTGEVGRHLLLVALCTNRRQVNCGNIGGEEPEEDGRWWTVR